MATCTGRRGSSTAWTARPPHPHPAPPSPPSQVQQAVVQGLLGQVVLATQVTPVQPGEEAAAVHGCGSTCISNSTLCENSCISCCTRVWQYMHQQQYTGEAVSYIHTNSTVQVIACMHHNSISAWCNTTSGTNGQWSSTCTCT